jgi:hypothetical protein
MEANFGRRAQSHKKRGKMVAFPPKRVTIHRALERACSLAVRRLPNRPSGQPRQLRLITVKNFLFFPRLHAIYCVIHCKPGCYQQFHAPEAAGSSASVGFHSPEPRQHEKRKSRESRFQRSGVTVRAHSEHVFLKLAPCPGLVIQPVPTKSAAHCFAFFAEIGRLPRK